MIKSDRAAWASSGLISGSGLEQAKTIGLSAISRYVDAVPRGAGRYDLNPADGSDEVYEDIGNAIGVGDTRHAVLQIKSAVCDYAVQLIGAADYEMVRRERERRRSVGEVLAFVDGELVGGTEIMQ